MGNFLWIFIGTTTFAGLLIYLAELFIDGSINKSILKKLITYDNKFNLDIDGDDFKMSFKDGKISFDNVVLKSNPKNNKNDDTDKKIGATEYKLTIDTINMTLSLGKWSEGRGLIKDVEIIGLVGDIDFKKNNEFFVDDSLCEDYEFEKLKISDLKVDFKSDNFKEPIELKVFSCDIDTVRRNWVVYDFLNANTLSGSFNGSLFTLHKRQNQYAHFREMEGEKDENPWKKITRLRIDPVDMSFICNDNSKFNWIQSAINLTTIEVPG
ncbi:unnamed protein product [Ambrosiozyma monospora]|uniref:Unnamed protein product n=1 Tax=Ambrosiozyma monospora TaxID=43982 RepID=A0A9W6T4L6_AMBMO|nr:unnamed protein product [Ambrosiozyma monospora]